MQIRLLSADYKDDGKSALRLNSRQVAALQSHLGKLVRREYAFESAPCPVCRSGMDEQIAQKDRYGIPLNVVICRNCGLIRTDPRMTQASYADFYATDYRQLYGGVDRPDEAFFHEQYQHGLRIIQSLTRVGWSLSPSGLVVEVGCGAGGILAAFRDQGAEVVGCDLGPEFLEYGRKKGLNLVLGFLKDIALQARSADVVIYSHVLEHVLDTAGELETVKRILKDDGLVYVEIPSVKSLHNPGYRENFLWLLQGAHTYHFSRQSLLNLMSVHGFECVYGNETVEAVFAQGGTSGWTSDYDDVLQYLRRTERTKRLFFTRPYFIRHVIRAVVPRPVKRFLRRMWGTGEGAR